jgi:hypothetical protein
VFANDIKRKKNFLVTFDKVIPAPREEATNILVNSLINI